MHKTFLSIHGSWHGRWAWESVKHCLAKKGYVAYTSTMAGHGPHTRRLAIRHQDCVSSVLKYVRKRELKNLILVAHSFGDNLPDEYCKRSSLRRLIRSTWTS